MWLEGSEVTAVAVAITVSCDRRGDRKRQRTVERIGTPRGQRLAASGAARLSAQGQWWDALQQIAVRTGNRFHGPRAAAQGRPTYKRAVIGIPLRTR